MKRSLIVPIATFLALGVAEAGAATAQEVPSELRFEPARPVAGETVAVWYLAPAGVDADRLVLRARLRTPAHDGYNWAMKQTTMAELRRGADGAYRGEFRLPADVVFAVFGVETPVADWADGNEGRPWELVVHGDDGRPLFDALRQRFNDYMGRDLREVLASARRAVELYPDVPGGWGLLNAAESWSGGAGEDAGARDRRRARALEVAERIGARPDLTADELSELVWLTAGTPAAEEWRDRLERAHPGHSAVLMRRLSEAQREHRESPAELLAVYEAAWTALEAAGPPATVREEDFRVSLASMALRLAAADDGEDPAHRWADRFRSVAPPDRQANTFLGIPRFHDAGLEAARQGIDRLRELRPADRELGHTAAEQRAAQDMALGAMKGRVGRALVAAGRAAEGAAMLRAAVARRPTVDVLRELGEAELALSDTAAALAAWARTAADPRTPSAFADTVRDRLGAGYDEARWRELRSAARAELVRVTRDRAVSRTVAGRALELSTSAGDRLTLASLTEGADGAVVVFVSRHCGFSMQAMPRIQELARDVAGSNVVVIPVTDDPVADDYPDVYRAIDVDIPVYHDVTGDVKHAFNVWGTPNYFVLDDRGVIRFEMSALPSIPLELAALRAEAPGR